MWERPKDLGPGTRDFGEQNVKTQVNCGLWGTDTRSTMSFRCKCTPRNSEELRKSK